MNKPNFSVAMIARNEELTIPRMVGSLKEFQERGGEILVLDTGSTDKTSEVAKGLGCIVYEVGDKFKITVDKELADNINAKFVVGDEAPVIKEGDSLFDFASARNYIATFCKTQFAFTPDCDEVLTMLNLDEVEKVLAEPDTDLLEYDFVFSHDDLGNPVIKFRHSKFYDINKYHWVGIIHEVLQPK